MAQEFSCNCFGDASPRFPGDALPMNKRGRDVAIDVALATRQPIQNVVEQIVAGTDACASTERKRVRVKLYAAGKIETLYGVLFDDLDVRNEEGTWHKIQFINPFALLAIASAKSLAFLRLIQGMQQRAVGQQLRFVLYHDGVVPGNNLRPDDGRAFVSFLWSIMELPRWIRMRGRLRWFTLFYITKKDMKRLGLDIPQLTKAILRKLFGSEDDFNFLTGIPLQHNGEEFILRMKPRIATPQDFEAHVYMFNLKGASGMNPCPCCENGIGIPREYFEDDSGFVHVYSSHYEKFKMRTQQRMKETIEEIKRVAESGNADALDAIEVATGIVYNKDGLLFDDWMLELLGFPECVYMDATHCLFGGGSVGQLTINAFVSTLVTSPTITVTLADLDAFGCRVQVPCRHARLPKTWFADRINIRPDANLKGFASETHSAAELLDMYIQVVIKPQGILQDEIEALECLCDVFLLLRRGDAGQAGTAFKKLQRHHELVMKLWPGVAKPKLHYSMHCILSWILFGILITCSGAEAEHKMPKRIMHTAYNKCGQTAMQYWMKSFMENVTDSKTYSTMFLNNFCHPTSAAEKFVYVGGNALQVVRYSMEIQTENGIYHARDFVYWEEDDGRYCGGVAVRFYETPYMGEFQQVFLAKVHRYELLPGPSGMMESGRTIFVDMRDIIDAVSYLHDKHGCVRPLVPRV